MAAGLRSSVATTARCFFFSCFDTNFGSRADRTNKNVLAALKRVTELMPYVKRLPMLKSISNAEEEGRSARLVKRALKLLALLMY